MSGPRRILVGVVGAAQGVKGEVRVKSYTAVPSAIRHYGPLSTEDGRRSFSITALRALKEDMLVVRFEGLADRDAAAALTGTRLYIDRARLPPPDEDEFYQADLIGLAAEHEDGRVLGQVGGIQNFGAGDLLAIVPSGGGDSLLVPFTRAFVPVLDFGGQRLVVASGALMPDGEHDLDPSGRDG